MAYLSEVYFKKETLETMLKVVNAKGDKGVAVTISINNDVKEFNAGDKVIQQNVSAFVSQSKEDREAKKEKYYVANGRQVWDDGSLAPSLKLYKEEGAGTQPPSVDDSNDIDDLPF